MFSLRRWLCLPAQADMARFGKIQRRGARISRDGPLEGLPDARGGRAQTCAQIASQ
jgi:hypothetical protein